MATLFSSTARTGWQAHMALRMWAAALLVLSATYAMADEGYPIVVDQHPPTATTPACVRPYSALYTKIQDAVNAAASGATILVCPGTYPEQITISKSLTLRGVTSGNAGAAVVTLPGSWVLTYFPVSAVLPFSDVVQIYVQAPNVNIIDVTVDGTGDSSCAGGLIGIGYDSGSSGTVRQVALMNHTDCGGGIGIASREATSFTVLDSSIRGFDATGIFVVGPANTPLVVKENVVTTTSPGFPGCIALTGQGQVTNNTVSGCSVDINLGGGPLTVSGNTVVNFSVLGIETLATGSNISGNTIASAVSTTVGIHDRVGTNSIQYNDLSAVGIGIRLLPLGQGAPPLNDTITQNTINGAGVGIQGGSGSNVSGNTFLNVTTLTQ
jgi:hypothetical protein